LKYQYLVPLLFLTGCSSWHVNSWFHKRPVPADPTQLVVTGAPAGSVLLIDGVQAGPESALADKPQLVDVAPGMHSVEIKVRDKIAYRESTFVVVGEKHAVVVLSGSRGD